MNAERPSSMRALYPWLGVALLGVLMLYAAGAGPAAYYETRFMNTDGKRGSVSGIRKLRSLYRPLLASVKGSPLETPLMSYRGWWSDRAWKKYPRYVCISSGFWINLDLSE